MPIKPYLKKDHKGGHQYASFIHKQGPLGLIETRMVGSVCDSGWFTKMGRICEYEKGLKTAYIQFFGIFISAVCV